MQQRKCHHFVPKAYLNAFCDEKGRLFVYRKDDPLVPLHVRPDKTQFRRYYYSQPILGGGQDNNTLEEFFSNIESNWPETVAKLHRRENVNDRLDNIFEFMVLQRVRVPAARNLSEAMLAQSVKDTMQLMVANGGLPLLPKGFEDLPNQVQVSIDPHRSIHAMVEMIQGMAPLISMLGFSAVHNATERSFLTSDNPVLWFDPSLSFDKQQPYTINLDSGPVFLFFPLSPKLALVGSTDTEYKTKFDRYGLLHSDVPDENWVNLMNEQVCRFAYEAVIAESTGQEEVIVRYAEVSPVFEAVTLSACKDMVAIYQQVFGPRVNKPKW